MKEERADSAGVGGLRGRVRVGGAGGGFTLVELLVVIAVIAILIGVLIPAVAGARQKARLVLSLNNARQIAAATLAYTYDHRDAWPVIPLLEPEPGQDGVVAFNSWNWGGKTNDPFWEMNYGGVNHVDVEDRVVNPYMYPDLVLRDPSDEERIELEVFRSPGDTESHQRDFWGEEVEPIPVSSYDDCGTSYHMNMKWWFQETARPGENDSGKWSRMRLLFRRGAWTSPSRFVWMHDQTIDVVAIRGITREGDYGGVNRSVASFMDGHVKYVRAEPGLFVTGEYSLIFE